MERKIELTHKQQIDNLIESIKDIADLEDLNKIIEELEWCKGVLLDKRRNE